jgi:hypothetical protein
VGLIRRAVVANWAYEAVLPASGWRGVNSSQVSRARITPRTYLQPPIANLGNLNLHWAQLNWGVDAGR